MFIPEDLVEWRQNQCARLIEARLALTTAERTQLAAAIEANVIALAAAFAGLLVGVPHRDDTDLATIVQAWLGAGPTGPWPAVAGADASITICRWSGGKRTSENGLAMPIRTGSDVLVPDIVLAPVVGYDNRGYRLGCGDGVLENRVLENKVALMPTPVIIGIALEQSRLPIFSPQPDDIRMHAIVTESGFYAAGDEGLQRLPAEQAVRYLRSMLALRPAKAALKAVEPLRIELSSPVCYASEFPDYFGETGDNEKT